MKIIPNKYKALSFTRSRLKDSLNYSLGYQRIPEVYCCKYLGIIVRNDLSWADQVSFYGTTFLNAYFKKGKLNTEF